MKNKIKTLAIGAAATAAMGMTAHAQSADALIDKLVDKGILTVKEANDLRDDSDKGFTTAFQAKTGMPDWVTGYKLSGDFRGRFDGQFADETAANSYSGGQVNFLDRYQLRYRLRVGLVVSMKDDLEVGFRLGTGNATGGPLSNNTTFGGNGSKKPIWVDAAYGRWTPIHEGAWNLMTTIGKMDQPFQTTAMMFDPDYTPEGAAGQLVYKFNDTQSLKFIAGAFVLDEVAASGADPYYSGAQAIWDSSWTPKVDTSFGVSVFDIANKNNLSVKNTNIAYGNAGNTRDLITGNLVNEYNPIVVDGSVTYKLDSFPFYNGAFPIKFAVEYLKNPGAKNNNEGYWAGVTFGKSGTKKTWDITYRYERLEADAWYDQLVDDDNAAFYVAQSPTPPPAAYPYNYNDNGASAKGGFIGGTNVKGHLVKFNYSLTDSLTFSFTAYINSLVIPVPSVKQSDAVHIMGDMMWKF